LREHQACFLLLGPARRTRYASAAKNGDARSDLKNALPHDSLTSVADLVEETIRRETGVIGASCGATATNLGILPAGFYDQPASLHDHPLVRLLPRLALPHSQSEIRGRMIQLRFDHQKKWRRRTTPLCPCDAAHGSQR